MNDEPGNRTRVKICCIQDLEEARLAISHGASAIGLVSAMPSGPGPIPESRIAVIAASVPPGIDTFLLTSEQTPEAVIRQQRALHVRTLQLVDEFPPEGYTRLRAELPGIRIVQVLHVRSEKAVGEAVDLAPHVDAILLDSGNPELRTKELGGTGKVHDWAISRKIVEAIDKPVYLAGGLKPENVRRAIESVKPFAVDVCSGVRTNGRLDKKKLADFFAAVG
ncbi:MAG TPA: phosphoribosylanthranilate isomerase [Bacteroidota bacterium]|nr:phosphoribosylanthranilate isomerase [Bacteroidota bacterium]